MKIYTKRGDSGMTDLFGGERVKKNHRRVMAFGDIDCANTAIGLAHSASDLSEELKSELVKIMKWLFAAGAEIATSPKEHAHVLLDRHLKNRLQDQHVVTLELAIDAMEERLSPLKSFILPCGSDGASRLHFARNMVRKAEISLIELQGLNEVVRPEIIKFFNRLSDFLFVMARLANAQAGINEVTWNGLFE